MGQRNIFLIEPTVISFSDPNFVPAFAARHRILQVGAILGTDNLAAVKRYANTCYLTCVQIW